MTVVPMVAAAIYIVLPVILCLDVIDVVFSHAASRTRLTVPARRPIKPVYVREFVAFIDEIRGQA